MALAGLEQGPLPPAPRPLPSEKAQEKGVTALPDKGTGRLVPSPREMDARREPFVVSSVPLRDEPGRGAYVALLGGLSFLQDATDPYTAGEATTPGSGVFISARIKEQEVPAPLAGLKVGYAWNFGEVGWEPMDQRGWTVGMGFEFEMLYTGQTLSGKNIALSSERTSIELDNLHFMVNGLILFQNGPWRPYFGGGIGGVYVEGSDYQYVSGLGFETAPDDSALAVSWQTVAGVEYFFLPDWSLFSEYKFLAISDLDIFEKSVTSLGFEADMRVGTFTNHYATFGIKKHF